MRFVLGEFPKRLRSRLEFPFAVLTRDAWDDYHFNTTFALTLFLSIGHVLELGRVKILRRGQKEGQTPMPKGAFQMLGNEYCSLGQAASYYELLQQAGPEVYVPLLRGLRDIAFLPVVEATFAGEPGLRTSLLRFDSAERALAEGRTLFHNVRRRVHLSFTYQLPASNAATEFRFGEVEALPNRLAVVIGYNGAGKTRLLAHLAMLAYADRREAASDEFVAANGRYVGERPSFGAIVAISYSAFDHFEVPGQGAGANAALDRARYEGRGVCSQLQLLRVAPARRGWRDPDDAQEHRAAHRRVPRQPHPRDCQGPWEVPAHGDPPARVGAIVSDDR